MNPDSIIPDRWESRCEQVAQLRAEYEQGNRWKKTARLDLAHQRFHRNKGLKYSIRIPRPEVFVTRPKLGHLYRADLAGWNALYDALNHVAGCYVGRSDNQCLYVGQSGNLAERVMDSHSRSGDSPMTDSTSILIYPITELRALEIIEYRLIRHHDPYFNVIRDVSACMKSWWDIDDSVLTKLDCEIGQKRYQLSQRWR